MEPALFYSGLVAELYAMLRSSDPDPEPYARFIARTGEPALELGCGDGDPLLELRRRGLDVEGLDSSADMLERCRARAGREGLDVVLHHAAIETMQLGARYRSIFLAGPTFNLIIDDETATRALDRIGQHLATDGLALIPLFIPEPVAGDHLGRPKTRETGEGATVSFTVTSVRRDETRRLQSATLLYERVGAGSDATLERDWVLHWHTQAGFRALVARAGLQVRAVIGPDGRPVADDAQQFVFIVGNG
ncbi:MAG: class I SAM-dependent methyltransferase [Actinomycetota bacterium]|nr:class I SAM-dependent methyltransferase [Actinomycetota bacterium]